VLVVKKTLVFLILSVCIATVALQGLFTAVQAGSPGGASPGGTSSGTLGSPSGGLGGASGGLGGSSGGGLATLPRDSGSGAPSSAAAGAPSGSAPRPSGKTLPSPNIVLLDVSYVFDHLPRFQQVMNDMKKDVTNADAAVKAENSAIQKLAQELELKSRGSPDYKRMEEQVITRKANLAAQVETQRREFMQRETKIYYDCYRQIQVVVNDYCAANNIDMVLRFSSDPVDPDNPNSVINTINKPVVTYVRDRDITPDILDILTKRSTSTGGSQGGSTVGSRPATPSLPLR
jgi:Skp family chaperone for outer membrane proteins